MEHAARTWIAALRGSHDDLVARADTLSDAQLTHLVLQRVVDRPGAVPSRQRGRDHDRIPRGGQRRTPDPRTRHRGGDPGSVQRPHPRGAGA